ncbi:TIGR03085 family metal-binding protein [Amycolatopsis sp. SID8362]|uniref:TIGR03085 family metal-binding protein n=1 Tax=Amycolatopsis sp. SID8362 TaxID=2690346 RepID=UPI001367EDAC|nr:TIGR03085 family metal-binding protein [Amycolatopsis sp. SID8362]NBH08905.1 TIGR03085 family protein [Amycolatopsis sp. SID8362]NED45597.1 TIGR03085 family protein [Amycolatopsis sp. SID8362]
MGVAADERQALSSLLRDLGPDAPTLCEGWTTRDLAAHLVVREHRPDAAPGILIPALAGHTQKVQDRYAAKPWGSLVEQVKKGPAKFWPTAIGPLDELTNTAEFLVHHEDVRRAQPGWEPRPADGTRDAAAWKSAKQAAKLNLRKAPVGVVLRTTTGQEAVVKAGPEPVAVIGAPIELLLFVFGRDAVHLEFEGDAAAVTKLQAVNRGL